MDIQFLDWDTEFFGFNTARILPPVLDRSRLNLLLDELRVKGTRLVYWSSQEEAPFDTASLGGYLVDRKTTFIINLRSTPLQPIVPPVHEYQAGSADESLYNLALQAGEFSRFARDPRFPSETFHALYHEWMRKCLTHEMADAILVTGEKTQPNGMVTVSKKNSWGEIGLIAVDSNARGLHLGQSLVGAAQRWYLEQSLGRARVVTQGDNLPACRLYLKCGYQIGKVEFLYHFWL